MMKIFYKEAFNFSTRKNLTKEELDFEFKNCLSFFIKNIVVRKNKNKIVMVLFFKKFEYFSSRNYLKNDGNLQ